MYQSINIIFIVRDAYKVITNPIFMRLFKTIEARDLIDRFNKIKKRGYL